MHNRFPPTEIITSSKSAAMPLHYSLLDYMMPAEPIPLTFVAFDSARSARRLISPAYHLANGHLYYTQNQPTLLPIIMTINAFNNDGLEDVNVTAELPYGDDAEEAEEYQAQATSYFSRNRNKIILIAVTALVIVFVSGTSVAVSHSKSMNSSFARAPKSSKVPKSSKAPKATSSKAPKATSSKTPKTKSPTTP